MKRTVRLTNASVTAAKFDGDAKANNCYLWDVDPQGFGVRVYPSGRKAFVLDYRTTNGRRRRMKLGNFPTLTVEEARKLARTQIAETYGGGDPLGAKEEARAQATVKELCERYMTEYAMTKKRSHRDDAERIRHYILPAFGARKVADVKRSEVAALHTRIGETHPHTANRVLSLISVIYRMADVWGLLPDDFQSPTRNIPKHPEKSRERFLTQEEAARLLQAVDMELDERFRLLVRLYLFTAAREQELLSLRWQDVDFLTGRVSFRGTKAGRDHYIKPSPEAMRLFKRLNDLREGDTPYVFPGRWQSEPLKGTKRAWNRVRKAAGLPDVHLHDLRRTAGSWMGQAGVNTVAISKTMNHAGLAVTQVYALATGEDTAEALAKLGEVVSRVEKVAAGGPKVVSLNEHRNGANLAANANAEEDAKAQSGGA